MKFTNIPLEGKFNQLLSSSVKAVYEMLRTVKSSRHAPRFLPGLLASHDSKPIVQWTIGFWRNKGRVNLFLFTGYIGTASPNAILPSCNNTSEPKNQGVNPYEN